MATITDNDLALFCERAKTELKSTGDIGRLAWDDIVEALCKEVARLRSVSRESGDVAKLSEALTKVKEWMEHRIATCGFEPSATFPTMLEDVVLPALATPSRNCDMPLVVDGSAHNNADKAWLAFRRHNPDAYFDVPGLLRCIDWLFAPATEKEGDNR